ncbi:MAG: hypothetical protein K2N43_05260 [Lachnospiraceae bacterium]|nr:hypothetical protein [Lachnospiraceae bacterium]
MRKNKKSTLSFCKTMLGCFTAILLLLGLMIDKEIPQPEVPQPGDSAVATLGLADSPTPNPTGLDDDGD